MSPLSPSGAIGAARTITQSSRRSPPRGQVLAIDRFRGLEYSAAIEALALGFERGTITIPNGPALLGEQQAFEAKPLPSGLTPYAAPEGLHDDCVMSLALAWQGLGTWFEHRTCRAIELEPVRISLV